MAEGFENLFIDVMKGDLKDFSDYFDMVINSIERSFAQGLAKMLTDWLFTLSDMESSSGGGLFGGISGIVGGLGKFLGIAGGLGSLSGLFGGIGGGTMAMSGGEEALMAMALLHKGGVVGMEGKGGYAPASLFDNAPRLHKGFSSDEMPVILQKGETVLPRGAGTTIINMFNVRGSIVTEREFTRKIVPLINKAQREGAH